MLKLVKYEWMSRWKFFLGGIILLTFFNLYIITKSPDNIDPKVFAITSIIIFVAGIVLMVDHIGRMYHSLFKETGYLLFTTPLSGYKILGGKIITVILECFGILLFGGLLMFIDYLIVISKYPELQMKLNIPNELIAYIMKFFVMFLLGYIIFILMAYLSAVLARSVFSVFKYGKLLSFICFLVIAEILGKIVELVDNTKHLVHIGFYGEIPTFNISNYYFIMIICIIGILFMITGYLLDRKINL
ncbi:hypothetical protein [Crassaminicella indica]|uniref:ABC transporter permease n=1 Tax=Crassaminicella indica TaxID=2855394 RepID=A0ABX8RDT1_9CLOT|nr:hypothetical protein [Crassaminicella indica]QXM06579.1 hypothetical protein KVH43_02185 [Crassaminicella indica]